MEDNEKHTQINNGVDYDRSNVSTATEADQQRTNTAAQIAPIWKWNQNIWRKVTSDAQLKPNISRTKNDKRVLLKKIWILNS